MTTLSAPQPVVPASIDGPRVPPKSAASSGRGARILLYLVLVLGLVLLVGPFVWMLLGAFKPQGEFLRLPPTWLPENPTLDNFQRLLSRLDFPRFFLNSAIGMTTRSPESSFEGSLVGAARARATRR